MNCVVIVRFVVKPGRMADFMPLMEENATRSVEDEAGCRQFDVVLSPAAADTVWLYEIYDDAAAFAVHQKTPHFLSFDKATAEMVADKMVVVGAPSPNSPAPSPL
ncbi:putative quinol monooxygenase [Acuticoccus kandeliae]|uniref:putative quinol monooxygenase n=1 Tax=Acuticoccus kandeliae TaxID=2073160 RepID=UPI000D3E79BD|nr:putative quinol monooxygenase [Acuticoccus kandeliae]